jgi:hypothetical protein
MSVFINRCQPENREATVKNRNPKIEDQGCWCRAFRRGRRYEAALADSMAVMKLAAVMIRRNG